eukprot:Polyplicarium_translucidae@DN3342_c3_g1_i1.p1
MIHKSDFAPVASEEPKGNPFHSGRFPSVDSSSSLGLGMALTAAGVDLQKVKPLESLIFDAELDDGLLHTVFASVVDPERYGITRWHIDVSPSFQELATSEGSGIAAIYPIWTGVLKGYVLGQEMLRNFTNSKFKPCPINANHKYPKEGGQNRRKRGHLQELQDAGVRSRTSSAPCRPGHTHGGTTTSVLYTRARRGRRDHARVKMTSSCFNSWRA